MTRPKSGRRRLVVGGVLVLGLLLVTETGSFVVYKVVVQRKASFLLYTPARIPAEEDYKDYLSARDPILGWPAVRPSAKHDISGSRPVPAFPKTGNKCVALYGDSFIYGEEVDDASAWGNLLSRNLNCPVANYGVGGYGTDQAYLRFKHSPSPVSPVTILGIFPQNVLRNVNQWRYLLSSGDPLGFKPRFVLGEGKLRLVPLPEVPYQDLEAFHDAPDEYLNHEVFLPNSAYGPLRYSFPSMLSLIRLALKERPANWFMGKPSWLAFASPGHPTRAMELTSAIVRQFHADSSAAESELVVIFFPTPSSFQRYQDSGTLALDLLAKDLQANGIRVLDLTAGFDRRLAEKSFCEILTQTEICQGHFNREGNAILAEIVFDYLYTERLIDLVK